MSNGNPAGDGAASGRQVQLPGAMSCVNPQCRRREGMLKAEIDRIHEEIETLRNAARNDADTLRQRSRDYENTISRLEAEIDRLNNRRRHTERTWPDVLRGNQKPYRVVYRLCCKEENISVNHQWVHPDIKLVKPRGRLRDDSVSEIEGNPGFQVAASRLSPLGRQDEKPFPFNNLPGEVQLRILQLVLHKRGHLIHCLSRLDPFVEPESLPTDEELGDGRSGLLNRFFWGGRECSITNDGVEPNRLLAVLSVSKRLYFLGVHIFYGLNTFAFSSLGEFGRFCQGSGLHRIARVQHMELLLTGNQYLSAPLDDRQKVPFSRRTYPLTWLTDMPRLKTLVIHINETGKKYIRRRYENPKIESFLSAKTAGQPNQRMSRSLRCVRGIDYVYQLRGLESCRFYNFARVLATKRNVRQPIQDWSFAEDVTNVVTMPKVPQRLEKSELRNLEPLFHGAQSWTPSDADWDLVQPVFLAGNGRCSYDDLRAQGRACDADLASYLSADGAQPWSESPSAASSSDEADSDSESGSGSSSDSGSDSLSGSGSSPDTDSSSDSGWDSDAAVITPSVRSARTRQPESESSLFVTQDEEDAPADFKSDAESKLEGADPNAEHLWPPASRDSSIELSSDSEPNSDLGSDLDSQSDSEESDARGANPFADLLQSIRKPDANHTRSSLFGASGTTPFPRRESTTSGLFVSPGPGLASPASPFSLSLGLVQGQPPYGAHSKREGTAASASPREIIDLTQGGDAEGDKDVGTTGEVTGEVTGDATGRANRKNKRDKQGSRHRLTTRRRRKSAVVRIKTSSGSEAGSASDSDFDSDLDSIFGSHGDAGESDDSSGNVAQDGDGDTNTDTDTESTSGDSATSVSDPDDSDLEMGQDAEEGSSSCGSGSDVNPGSDPDSDPDSDMDSDLDSDMDSDLDSDMDSDLDSDMASDPDSDPDSDSDDSNTVPGGVGTQSTARGQLHGPGLPTFGGGSRRGSAGIKRSRSSDERAGAVSPGGSQTKKPRFGSIEGLGRG